VSLELDQFVGADTDYFDLESNDGNLLAYPSRAWVGRRADISIYGSTAVPPHQPIAADSGTVIVMMGDCVGSMESQRLEGSGATIKIDGQPDGIYRGTGGWIPSRGSGSMAEFDKVPAGLQTVRGLDPGGRVVAAKQAWVRNGAVTWVYFNFPMFEQ